MAKHDYQLTRREWMRLTSAGVVGFSMSGWIEALARETVNNPQRRKSCILLWMNGGPSQIDTFDLKPNHENGGEFKEIQTNVPGIKISEHLPKISKFMDKMAIVRSMSTKEGDHGRGTFLMRTGELPQGPIHYPTIGASLSKELGDDQSELPNFVSIAPYRFFNPAAWGPGFLGPKYAPLIVGDATRAFRTNDADAYQELLKVQNLQPYGDVSKEQVDARISLLQSLEHDFVRKHPGISPKSHQTAYDRAVRLMRSEAAKAFDLSEEKDETRDAYGRNLFGQGCLLARRLIERKVPFVEVTLSRVPGLNVFGWDTHNNNFPTVRRLCEILDPAWAALMSDLKDRGLLDSTLIVWMGEFGRTPKIPRGRQNGGRDHYPNAWSTVLAGGGIKGGQVVGRTSADGTTVEERPVNSHDFLATICKALGVDPHKYNPSNVGRPIPIVDKKARPIEEIL
ncbi:MAG: hypothetical protein KatS3mg105_3335 [Gemmatales bacterium]|nr:MAG: hypothetical protein KatS3mg105_3335 [Gemmatales bacterium]